MLATTVRPAKVSNRVDSIVATTVLGVAILVSGLTFASAATPNDATPVNNVNMVIISGGSGATVTVAGSSGANL